jgi:hypothetical protein
VTGSSTRLGGLVALDVLSVVVALAPNVGTVASYVQIIAVVLLVGSVACWSRLALTKVKSSAAVVLSTVGLMFIALWPALTVPVTSVSAAGGTTLACASRVHDGPILSIKESALPPGVLCTTSARPKVRTNISDSRAVTAAWELLFLAIATWAAGLALTIRALFLRALHN